MKVHIGPEKTHGKTSLAQGLPDAKDLNHTVAAERRRRVTEAFSTNDAAAMMKASMALGGLGRAWQFSREPGGMADKRG